MTRARTPTPPSGSTTASESSSPGSLPKRSSIPRRPRRRASMARVPLICAAAGAFALAALFSGLQAPLHKAHAQVAPACTAPPQLTKFTHRLPRLAELVAQRLPITIIAIGSSSTAGVGAGSPAATYPARLEALLRERATGVGMINVLNRGVGGEEEADMLARFDRDVIAEKPDLVLWQVGSNAIVRAREPATEAARVRDGIARLKATGADVVLIDPQYTAAIVAQPVAVPIVEMIA